MSGQKGMQLDSEEFKQMVREEEKKDFGQGALSKRYGSSRYTIQRWCGLRLEVDLPHSAP